MKSKITQTQLRIVLDDKNLTRLLKLYNLDKITLFHAQKLLQSMLDCRDDRTRPECTKHNGIFASLVYHIGPQTGNDCPSNGLYLSNVCDINKCRCDSNYTTANTTKPERKMQCFKQLASGKCTDEFMRRTLGATFFPEKYAKQK